jgi:antitoxin VapB
LNSRKILRGPLMGMNIRDPAVHAMARKLASRNGITVTEAVRQALKAELLKAGCESHAHAQLERQQKLVELLERFRGLPWPEDVFSLELQQDLYNEQDLPI